MSIKDQLGPLIRQRGIRKVARATGISPSILSIWLRTSGPRRLGDRQLEALADAVGVQFQLVATDTTEIADIASASPGEAAPVAAEHDPQPT